MKIDHLIKFVDGVFDTDKGKLICVGNRKYGLVELCFSEGVNIPFAKIKLYTRDRAVDADAVFDDAKKLGEEVAHRWNTRNPSPDLTEAIDALSKLVSTIEQWEEDVRKVVHIPVEHGMDLREAKAILAKHKEG